MTSLSYTSLDSESIQEGLDVKLSSTVGLENYKDSSNMKIVTDVVKAMVDINNYNIERQAEELFPDTSSLDSSAIGRANLLGYSVKLPRPAKSHITITVRGGIFQQSETYNNQTISFNKWFKFQYNDIPYVLKSSYKIELTQDEFTSLKNTNTKLIFNKSRYFNNGEVVSGNELIDIVQGEFKEITFDSTKYKSYFQVFEIADNTFSNYFGRFDENYSEDIVKSLASSCYSTFYTYVGTSGDNKNVKENPFYIERESLSRPDLSDGTNSPKVCKIRARKDGGVQILFGGANSENDNDYSFSGGFSERAIGDVLVKYFSTVGSKGNRSDVIGKNLKLVDNVYIDGTSIDITNYVTISFNRSSYNGADRESKESIDLNAPSSYASKNRLVTKKDYESYLKGMTIDGKSVYGATAWSENDEAKSRGVRSVKELANRTLFSVISSLYDKDDNGNWEPTNDISKSIIETLEEYNVTKSTYDSVLNTWTIPMFSNTFVSSYFTDKFFKTKEPNSVKGWSEEMDDMSMMTVVNRYVSPTIHKFSLDGVVTIGTADSILNVSRNVKNVLYSYFDSISNFKKRVNISNVISLIEKNPSVKRINNINFVGSNNYIKPNVYLSDLYLNGSGVTDIDTVENRINVLTDINNVFGNLTDKTTNFSDKTGEELYSAMYDFYIVERYGKIPIELVFEFYKVLFSTSYGLPAYVNYNNTFRSFNTSFASLINKGISAMFPGSSNDIMLFDMFTLYNSVLSYCGSSISNNVVSSGDVSNFTVGNEIPIIEINLRYVYG